MLGLTNNFTTFYLNKINKAPLNLNTKPFYFIVEGFFMLIQYFTHQIRNNALNAKKIS